MSERPTPSTAIFRFAVAAIAIATIAGIALLWPDGSSDIELAAGPSGESEPGRIVALEANPCPPPIQGECLEGRVLIEGGLEAGREVTVELSAGGPVPDFAVGDQVRVAKASFGGSAPPDSVIDFERRSPMIWLAVAFVALVILFGRLRGVLSLLGLILSLAAVVVFIVPAILDGRPPLAVALVGSMAVMLITILLSHGRGPKSLAAILGTAASLLLVGLLASLATGVTNLTGFSSEEAALLAVNDPGLSISGLLVAGIVIGALGVLDDVTISQASTVLALRAAAPDEGFGSLYRRAIEVGRDHVSATVNTLVLAYVGSSLPLLLIFGVGELGAWDTVNLEIVAKEIVAMLVGSIGIIAAVPLTTALAAWLAGSIPADELEADAGHGHHH
ncbi:MAG: YibE/F family protein [Solirubrobacterales bacterium]